jgi:glycosyltransferase involved in cell wall biosynthesis
LSVVLPAFNQEASLEKTLTGWLTYLESLGREYEILVVDDGSTDHTAERAETLARQHPRLRVLRQTNPVGYGAALRTGLAATQHPLFFYADCTNAYHPEDLKGLLELIDKVHVVTGHRTTERGRRWRKWSEYAYQWLVRLGFGVRLKDVNCAFKLFRRSIFARIPIQSDGSFVHAEILAKANFLGCLLSDVAIHYQPDQASCAPHPSRHSWPADARRVFSHPDFGPAVLPPSAVPTSWPPGQKLTER